MLTKSATTTRACSASPRICSTQPVSVSLRHISSGSHQKHRVQQGDSHRPQGEHRKGCCACGLVLVRVARERQVGVQVAPRCALIVLECLAQKRPEDPRRCARQHQEGEPKRKGQHSPQPGWERGAEAPCQTLIAPLAAMLCDFGAGKAHGAHEYDGQRPGRADQYAGAVVAQARGGHHEDALKLGRQLEEVNPPGEVLQPHGWLHIVDAWHRSDALNLEAASNGGTATNRGEKDEKQHCARQDHGSGGHVAAIVAASIQLVKMPGVGGPSTQLASRPAVAGGAVATPLGTGITTAVARAPAAIRHATMRLDGCRRVAPVACRKVECRNGGVCAADNALDRSARRALACRRVCNWPVLVCSAYRLGNGRPELAYKSNWTELTIGTRSK
eukprot:5310429-Prymnesium_polylepis.2